MASVNARRPLGGTSQFAVDLFVSSVNTIEVIGGGMVRVSFMVNRNHGEGMEAEPADWALVMPISSFPDGIGKAIAVTTKSIFAHGGDGGSITLVQ